MDTFWKKRNIEQREWPTDTIKNIGTFFSNIVCAIYFFPKFIFKNKPTQNGRCYAEESQGS